MWDVLRKAWLGAMCKVFGRVTRFVYFHESLCNANDPVLCIEARFIGASVCWLGIATVENVNDYLIGYIWNY